MWLLAALNACGRYLAPERPGHPADLEDDGRVVDSIVLMAVRQRHFLGRAAPAWDDASLGRDLGLDTVDLAARATRPRSVLHLPICVSQTGPDRPALVARTGRLMSLRTRRADEIMLRRYRRVLTPEEIAQAVRRTPPLRARAIRQSAAGTQTREPAVRA